MISLIETYARSTGLKIDKPYIKEDFWPIAFTKFITLSAGSGQAAKNYDNFQFIIDMLNPILGPLDIHIVQIGDKDTPLFSGTHDLRAKTNLAQSTNLIKRAMVHFGCDSWSAHVAGFVGTPLCVLYGTTDKDAHGPYWKDNTKTILLESHRHGRKPTYGAEQQPKSINLIPPEQVANSILRLLRLDARVNQSTKFIGVLHPHTIFDYIPDLPFGLNLPIEVPVSVRMDIEFNEANLISLLQTGRKITIITKKSVNLQLLAGFRQNILSYNHEIDETCPLDYPARVKSIIPNSVFFTREKIEDELSKLRFRYFGSCNIEQVLYTTKTDFLRESAAYLNKTLDNNPQIDIMKFKSNKFIMSNGKIYLSYAHRIADQSITDLANRIGAVIDSELFWQDINHFWIYEQPN